MRSACSQLKSRNAPPLLRTRVVGPDGTTTITTDPAVVDQVAIDAWAHVHRGNVGPAAAPLLAASFLGTFGEHFPFSDPHCLYLITGEQVSSDIGKMPANTPGLDGVRKDDLSILSPYACQCLADMMNAIEAGCPWPKQCAVGRLAFLSKGGDPLDPVDYRKLSILSKVYRLHMSIRLKDLAPWVSTWTLPELFAGTCSPNGAEDAWFETALIVELAKLQDNPLTGGRDRHLQVL